MSARPRETLVGSQESFSPSDPWRVPSPLDRTQFLTTRIDAQRKCISLESSDGSVLPFRFDVPIVWHEISTTRTVELLQEILPRGTFASGDSATRLREWVLQLKYTHPSYVVAQRIERRLAAVSLMRVIQSIDRRPIQDRRIALIGANNCTELETIANCGAPKTVLAVDIAYEALRRGKVRYPHIEVCNSAAETLHLARDERGRLIFDKAANSYDVCFALRLLQSAGIDKRIVLERMKDLLKPGGHLIVSTPKSTADDSGEMVPGIWKSPLESGPNSHSATAAFEETLEIVRAHQGFTDVVARFGTNTDVEFYISARCLP